MLNIICIFAIKNINMVYLIKSFSNNKCKIGYTINVIKRLAELQTGNPHLLSVEYVIIDGNRKLEKELHVKFDQYRTKGEWFTCNQEIDNYFIEHGEDKKYFYNTTRINVISPALQLDVLNNNDRHVFVHILEKYGHKATSSDDFIDCVLDYNELNSDTIIACLNKLIQLDFILKGTNKKFYVNSCYKHKPFNVVK
jgi:hypothetical protein